ncbi:MAG TPA: YtxH domain-containing protein [Pyrinomonadaceae bacterium]|nr:YtxH domain-containing protein [Pyrinomonadaceae bacterium]
MNRIFAILGAVGAGAALMYLFDPNGGRRRRALIRDKAVGISNDVTQAVEAKSHDLANRAQGFLHEAKSLVGAGGTVENSAPEQSDRAI